MGYIHGANRHEVIFFPERLDDYMAEANPVRFIDAFVDELDMAACGFHRAVPAVTGRPGYAPGDLLQLSRYGDLYCLRSSRRLEQETHRKVEVMWRLKKLRPDHKTIAAFRTNNLKPMRQVCRTLTLLCKQLDRFGAELLAIDGSKFRAVHATERNLTKARLTKLLAPIAERLDAYLQALDRSDEQDDQGPGGDAQTEALAAKMEALKQRKLLYEGFQAPLLATSQDPLSLTDPERRSMKRGKSRGTAVCSNVQTAVDSQHKLIVACEVTNDPGDRDWRSPLALHAKAGLDGRVEVVAEVGDDHGHAVKTGLDAGITPYGPRPITSATEKLGLCSKDDFIYDKGTDTNQCPAGARLTCRFDTVELGRHIRSSATPACGDWVLKQQCTRSKGGRRITRWVDEQLMEEMAPRVRSRPEVMKRRKELVEHPLGTMQRGWEHGYFLRRGLEKVRTEFSLTVLADNLRRVLNLVEMPRLLAALG
jgi:transposase